MAVDTEKPEASTAPALDAQGTQEVINGPIGPERESSPEISGIKAKTTEELLQQLRELEDVVQAKNKELEERDKAIAREKKENRELQTRIGAIMAEDHELEICKRTCRCDEDDLVAIPREPNYKAAARIYNNAKKSSIEKQKETVRKKGKVHSCILGMLRSHIGLPLTMTGDKQSSFLTDLLPEIATEITEKIMKKKDIKKDIQIVDIVDAFKEKQQELEHKSSEYPSRVNLHFDAKKMLEENAEPFEELVALLDAKKPIKLYLLKLINDIDDVRIMDLPAIWREKLPSYSDAEKRSELESIAESAQSANSCSHIFFKETGGLHPDILAKNYLRDLSAKECEEMGIDPKSPQRNGLCSVVAKTLPLDENSFKMLVSAMAKINMMHLAETIRSQVDLQQMRVVREHLEKHLGLYLSKTYDGKDILNSGKNNQDDEVICESVEVPDEKSLESIFRKFMDKDAENTRDFDINAIHDLIRFGVMLTKEDSESPEKIERVTKKIIAIILTIFGTDISNGRLRYAFDSGVTNGNSTGKHQAIHFTFRYRNQCKSGGKNKWGTDKIRTIPVEVQIQKYMTSEERRADHLDYKQKKDRKITRVAGMDVTFTTFITDLCDALLNDHEFFDEVKITRKTTEFPINEKMARILFTVLAGRDENGILINGRPISELKEDKRQWQKMKDVIEKYKNYEARHIRLIKGKIEERKAKGRHQRKYEGWRKKVQENVLAPEYDGTSIPSPINQLALEAEKIINNFEKLVSDRPISPRQPMTSDSDEFMDDEE